MVIDGVVALLPVINEPIIGGQVQISGDSASEDYQETVAILVGGILPESWRGARVVAAMPREQNRGQPRFASCPTPRVRSVELDVAPRWHSRRRSLARGLAG